MPKFLTTELPVLCRIGHHWITLLKPPGKFRLAAYVLLFVVAVFAKSVLCWVVFVVVLGGAWYFRIAGWKAEQVILTRKRIIRVQGIPETTSSEAWLRVDRVSGLRLVETVPGKIFGYATIELEAPGEHPGLRKLERMRDAETFYMHLRRIVFAEGHAPDPDDDPNGYVEDYVTEPLPSLPPARSRFGRRVD